MRSVRQIDNQASLLNFHLDISTLVLMVMEIKLENARNFKLFSFHLLVSFQISENLFFSQSLQFK